MNILDLIRNAKDGSYVDFRTADGQIDSVPIDEIRALLPIPAGTRLADIAPNGIIATNIGEGNFDIIAVSPPSPIK